jgi:outer membrane biosynthesis protein TonB
MTNKIDWKTVEQVTASFSLKGNDSPGSFLPRSTLQNDYIRACKEKILRQGELSNFARFDGRVVVSVTVDKAGQATNVSADVSDEMPANLRIAAMDVVRKSAPFAEFSSALLMETETIRFIAPIRFVSRN